MATPKFSNRLANETSPYLLQHAHNPVDWYAWGKEALARARREDKPILLSVGYSACHWCHVMEHESFEDEAVASVMNEHFVCIKVDREERPDLDKIYQLAHQILAQRPGGWPLNMFLMPDDHTPFFGGTYFPKAPRHGMPGFVDVMQRVAAAYRERRADIENQNDAVREVLARLEPAAPAPGIKLDESVFERALAEFKNQYDPKWGGLGGAPKFPHPTSLDFLLRHCARLATAPLEARDMAHHSLTRMALGGLFDQLGGGFYRYSVDDRWAIPHFEKMLYDNAQLLCLYTDAAVAFGDALFKRVALENGEWALREMQAPEGGYYSALDADSEGHEGKFYVWQTDDLRALLSPEEFELVERHYGLTGTPNFEGAWHLNVRHTLADCANHFSKTEAEITQTLSRARTKLFQARDRRIRPGRDDKILTSWNGLLIKAMARAGRLLHEPRFVASAEHALEYVRTHLWKNDRLLATAKDGKAHLNAYLDDYAFTLDALLELLQARWRKADLDFARALADALLEHFEDEPKGGFYFTSDDHEKLLHRTKPTLDEATPSGNGVTAQCLLRLGHVLGDLHYLRAGERTLEALGQSLLEHPSAYGSLLVTLEETLHPTQTVVLRADAENLKRFSARANARYAPSRLLLPIPPNESGLDGLLAERKPLAGEATAYVCRGHECQAPITNFESFDKEMATREWQPHG
jgi:hypothetical protein